MFELCFIIMVPKPPVLLVDVGTVVGFTNQTTHKEQTVER